MLLRLISVAGLCCFAACAPTKAPVPVVVTDSDHDGVIEALDRCPDTKTDVPVDAYGCPQDKDLDGVFDYLDNCADTPRGVAVNRLGCPLDDDGDGIINERDRCGGTVPGSLVDSTGCVKPVTPPPAETLELNITFQTGSARLITDFADEFLGGARFIKSKPHCRAVIAGHTDNVGPEAYNQALSLRRAKVARDAILALTGDDKIDLEVAGYGETQPVIDNLTQEHRLQNRRVMISITCDSLRK